MTESSDERRHWGLRPGDGDLIWRHLLRQRDLDPLRFVRLDDDRVVRVGIHTEGEET